MNQHCFLNGKIMPMAEANVNVLDIGLLRGYGVYEGIAGIAGKPLRFVDHWNRFLSGAHVLNLNVPITEEKAEKVIVELLEKNNQTDRANIRFILTGGQTIGGIEYDFEKPTFYIVTEKWEALPQGLYTEGAKLVTYRHLRELPEYKTINYIRAVNLQNWRKEEKTLITPSENVLKGITRNITLELAGENYKIEERPIREEELKTCDEAFITSSFKDIVPITKIDDFKVGDGQVGSVTKNLMARFASALNLCYILLVPY